MNTQLEITRQNVADQITIHKNIRSGIIKKYEQDKARVDGALDILSDVLSSIKKQVDKDAAKGAAPQAPKEEA